MIVTMLKLIGVGLFGKCESCQHLHRVEAAATNYSPVQTRIPTWLFIHFFNKTFIENEQNGLELILHPDFYEPTTIFAVAI